jgi:hypothetical protein
MDSASVEAMITLDFSRDGAPVIQCNLHSTPVYKWDWSRKWPCVQCGSRPSATGSSSNCEKQNLQNKTALLCTKQYKTPPCQLAMKLLTPHGISTYALILQQLYNWHVDWSFMDDWIPFHMVRYHCVRYVMRWYDLSAYPIHPQLVCMPMLFERHNPVTTPWVEPEDAPPETFVDNIFTGAPLYRPVLHMVLLYHGRIPTRDARRVFRWLRRLRLQCARRVLLLRLRHLDDAVDRILAHCNAAEVCNIWRAQDFYLNWPL